jgi:hypothetical protein
MQELLKLHNVSVVKLSASRTEGEQPLDDSQVFHASKTIVRHVTEEQLAPFNSTMASFQDVFKGRNEDSVWKLRRLRKLRRKCRKPLQPS